jgi:uncharacterized protein (TIGR00106 family)
MQRGVARIPSGKETVMLAELSIIPVGEGPHISEQIAIALKFVDASGLPYQLTPSGTCIEGEWDQVMSVIRQCHERVRSLSPHVMTLIKIEEDEGEPNKLTRNVTSVQEKVSRPLNTTPQRAS